MLLPIPAPEPVIIAILSLSFISSPFPDHQTPQPANLQPTNLNLADSHWQSLETPAMMETGSLSLKSDRAVQPRRP
jgi:hypothetical protein